MSDRRTLKEMLPEWIEVPGRHFVGWDGDWTKRVLEEFAEAIVRRAAEVAQGAWEQSEAADLAILVDAGLDFVQEHAKKLCDECEGTGAVDYAGGETWCRKCNGTGRGEEKGEKP